MNPAVAISRSKSREWPSYHGSPTPLRTDPMVVGEEFVRALHHRLCQPLTALSCALEVMQLGREEDARLTEQIQSALVQSEKIAEMMGVFRQMFEATNPPDEHHAVPLGQILQEVVQDLMPLADLQRITLTLEGHRDNTAVDMPQRSLRQALWGTIQNCIEATEARGRIRITHRDTHLIVCDTARSTETEIENCFDPFSYTANKTTRVPVSNLPVALAHRLVVATGGALTVAASPEGRCFLFKFVPARPPRI